MSNKYGVEIEVEGVPSPFSVANGHFEPDGSLRNHGIEYISDVLDGEDATKAWNEDVVSQLVGIGADFSRRCGVHIHIDFRGKTSKQIRVFLHRYLTMERHICSVVGFGRDKNTFCLPWLDNDGDFQAISNYVRTGRSSTVERASKYTALNIRPLSYQGSIEFRMLPSLPTVTLFNQVVDIFKDIQEMTQANLIAKYQIPPQDVLEADAFYSNLKKRTPEQQSFEFLDEHFGSSVPEEEEDRPRPRSRSRSLTMPSFPLFDDTTAARMYGGSEHPPQVPQPSLSALDEQSVIQYLQENF